jgi:hypothetical protein
LPTHSRAGSRISPSSPSPFAFVNTP